MAGAPREWPAGGYGRQLQHRRRPGFHRAGRPITTPARKIWCWPRTSVIVVVLDQCPHDNGSAGE
ncbi:hypothetical protein [Paenibacillus physcomitrellae]|uniref:hypothetical protein n=1 Tax=Paenibacillus physcomitrellae TaxID=1619311 RepID=UPI00157F8CEB|nr:hypothetical protein [Paenibacillus physcomitrellae]